MRAVGGGAAAEIGENFVDRVSAAGGHAEHDRKDVADAAAAGRIGFLRVGSEIAARC